jgi:hypothetical protein
LFEAKCDYVTTWETFEDGTPLTIETAQALQAAAAGHLADILDNGKVLKVLASAKKDE